jgi:hypothetical protein
MNNHEAYQRRENRTVPEPPTPDTHTQDAATAGAVSALAVHRDPSFTTKASSAGATTQRPGIVWVRPSELPTLVGSPLVGRGINLQTELIRRSRRIPLTAARAGRRVTRTSIAAPQPAPPHMTSSQDLRQ